MILVTGGAGFIGSALVAALNGRGIEDILIVDILGEDMRWKNLRGLRYADYMEADDFSHMVAGEPMEWDVEAIFHLGACTDPHETDASYVVKNNFEFSKLLAGWAIEIGAKFIYASCASTYGDGSAGFADDESRIAELTPLTVTAYSKQMFDLWCRQKGLLERFCGLKYFDVFGPNEYHKGPACSFVLRAFEQIQAEGRATLFTSPDADCGNGEQRRDFIYVKDAVDMTLFFLENPDVSGLFNIGTGQARSWNDVARAVFMALGKEPVIEYAEMPQDMHPIYPNFAQADLSKLRAAGYHEPTALLEEAVADYVQRYLISGRYLRA